LLRLQHFQIIALYGAVAGCQFADLAQEIDQMEEFSAISGRIELDTPSGDPVAVALFSDALQRDELVDAQLIETREFHFAAPPGNYFIFAFEDTNRDFRYQPNERAGYFGDPTAIALQAGADQADIRIRLRKNLSLPDSEGASTTASERDNGAFPKLWVGRKNVGAIASLENAQFGEEFGNLGMWEPLRFSLEVGPGLFLLEPYDPNKTPILFVHGIDSTPQAWREIIERLDRRRFQPWVLSYASGLPLEANADYMFDAVTQLRLLHDFERLFIVAHSMGGLLSHAFVDRHRADSTGYLKFFVTLATPWGGHSAAQLGVDYAPAVVPVWRDLAPTSTFLSTLQSSDLPENLPYHLMFSYRGGGLPSTTANDGAVSVASQLHLAAQARAERIYGFDTSHTDILSDDTVIQLLNEILTSALESPE